MEIKTKQTAEDTMKLSVILHCLLLQEQPKSTIKSLQQAQEGKLMHIMDLANRGVNLLLNFLLIVLVLVLAFILVKLM